ncbi:MAG TPA: FKBP-type peptidyl-prolyl cis-trans isomerase N-terminal domain-containing protein, partial [Verrucomicrobiaceae bacterium]
MKDTNMNRRWMTFLAVGLLVNAVRAADDKPAFKDSKDKNSYAVGANWGNSLKRQEVNVDLELLIKGLREGFDGHSALTDEELKQCMMALNQEIRSHQQEKRKELGEKNK